MNERKERQQLIEDEGLELKPYKCTSGKLTIGVGRNLDDNGITEDEAIFLMDNDLRRTKKELVKAIPWVEFKPEEVQLVLVNMAFNLGVTRLGRFKKTLEFMRKGEYIKASAEMLDSKWANQVGPRAKRLSDRVRKVGESEAVKQSRAERLDEVRKKIKSLQQEESELLGL